MQKPPDNTNNQGMSRRAFLKRTTAGILGAIVASNVFRTEATGFDGGYYYENTWLYIEFDVNQAFEFTCTGEGYDVFMRIDWMNESHDPKISNFKLTGWVTGEVCELLPAKVIAGATYTKVNDTRFGHRYTFPAGTHVKIQCKELKQQN